MTAEKDKTSDQIERARRFQDAEVCRRFTEQRLLPRPGGIGEPPPTQYRWSDGHGWWRWSGKVWVTSSEVELTEVARRWVIAESDRVLNDWKTRRNSQTEGEGKVILAELAHLNSLMSRARLTSLVKLAQGMEGVQTDPAAFDADPDVLNTPDGVVDLRTGEVSAHHPGRMITRLTRGSFRPDDDGGRHADWTAALDALDPPASEWLQTRMGQAATGHPAPDGVMVLLQGAGENGKSALTTDGPVVALGDYAGVASAKLLVAGRGQDHSTEMADLQGQRLLVAEEMTEGRALDVATLKRIMDVGTIRARRLYRDNFEFRASHSLFMTSNYRPVVAETDHGTWRRLALLRFRRTFRKPGEPLQHSDDRPGDPGLKERIKSGATGQHDAIVTWVVHGAIRAHKDPNSLAPLPSVVADTRAWRAEADRVLGLWSDLLVPDPGCCVIATELHDGLSEWLAAAGHRPWPRETFTGRFGDHAETRRHGVEVRQLAVERDPTLGIDVARSSDGGPWWVHRRPTLMPMRALPQRPRVWLGVRWRTDNERTDADQPP